MTTGIDHGDAVRDAEACGLGLGCRQHLLCVFERKTGECSWHVASPQYGQDSYSKRPSLWPGAILTRHERRATMDNTDNTDKRKAIRAGASPTPCFPGRGAFF